MPAAVTAHPPRRAGIAAALTAVLAALAITLTTAVAAFAAPPNDSSATPTVLSLPASTTGTTDGSTLETGESSLAAGESVSGSVWYQLSSPQARHAIIRIAAAGELDAAVEVLRRSRSQLVPETGGLTDEKGRLELDLDLRAKAVYLVRVAQRATSVAGTFRLDVFVPEPLPLGPGAPLPAAGATGSVDPLGRTAQAWTAVLHAGTTYRVHLVNRSSRRLGLAVYGPGTRDFTVAETVGSSRPYQLITPAAGEGGHYSFLVSAGRRGRAQPYRMQVGTAGEDDLWPGILLRNFQRVHGALDEGGLDVVDTYRFDLKSRSAVTVAVRAGSTGAFNVHLLRASGHRLGSAVGTGGTIRLTRTLRPGRYVVAVRARRGGRGTYTVRRAARTVTRLRLARRGSGTVDPGSSVALDLRLLPDVTGPVSVTIERFDPATGWFYDRTLRTKVVGGTGSVSFRPPTIGRWRARAAFRGTHTAQPSATRSDVHWLVARPLETG